jgi:hypothetical protein
VSVPWEPYFRLGNLCRGKDVGRWGNNPEHVQQFRPSTLRVLLGRHFGEARISPCFPWIVAVATPFAADSDLGTAAFRAPSSTS